MEMAVLEGAAEMAVPYGLTHSVTTTWEERNKRDAAPSEHPLCAGSFTSLISFNLIFIYFSRRRAGQAWEKQNKALKDGWCDGMGDEPWLAEEGVCAQVSLSFSSASPPSLLSSILALFTLQPC